MSLEAINQGISIFVAAYPTKPTAAQKTAMFRFLTYFSRILQHEDIPTWYKVNFFTRMSPSMTRSQETLTKWLMSLNRFRIWFDATDVIESPRTWGPYVWNFFNTLGLLFVPHRAAFFHKIVKLLPDILPCPECAERLRKLLATASWSRKLRRCTTESKYLQFLADLEHHIKQHHVKKSEPLKTNVHSLESSA